MEKTPKPDHRALLEYMCKKHNITEKQLRQQYAVELQLANAQRVDTINTPSNKQWNGQQLYTIEHIWSTPRALIKTTQYGRIKSIEWRKSQTPVVVIKRKRTIQKS